MTKEVIKAGGNFAPEKLVKYIERLEALNSEKDGLAADIKEVNEQAKADGFDVSTIKEVLKQRKLSKEKRDKKAEQLELYLHAVGLE